MMFRFLNRSILSKKSLAAALMLAVGLCLPLAAHADKKKKKTTASTEPAGPRKFKFDPKKLAWPSPPNIARVKWLDYYAGSKIDYSPSANKTKASWMDRLAGAQSDAEKVNLKAFPFQLIAPSGIAFDSKGLVYVADQRVGAIFIYDPETHATQMIRNGIEAHFGWLNGIAIDDDDRLFVADGKLHRVVIFNAKREVEAQINDGLVDPVGIALDTTNRYLYVVDLQQDQVVVFDADTLKELRRIGTGGKKHFLTTPGDFGAPQGVAVDKDGNVYVTDTLNNRVEIFDADGVFISTFGKAGDGPGFFERPKGIAIDNDGHVWVADAMQDRLQVFNREGQLLTFIGYSHGEMPGQFKALVGVAIDKKNRVYTAEQLPGRIQTFQYVTDSEAAVEKVKHQAELDKAAAEKQKKNGGAAPALDKPADKPADAPAAQPTTQPAPATTTPAAPGN